MTDNRKAKRTGAALSRQAPTVSARLLQRQYEELEKTSSQMRNVLFAILKEQGRIRVARATIDSLDALGAESHLNAEWQGDTLVIEYRAGVKPEPGAA